MLNVWTIIGIALIYIGLLVAIAGFGDRNVYARRSNWLRPLIYSLSLAVYCSAWAFFGSVGKAARSGFDFLPFFIGPFIVLVAGWPVLRIIVDVSKRQNITSIADFISTRYGRNRALGGLVALIAVIGGVPYVALQLRAVVFSLEAILPQLSQAAETPASGALVDYVPLVVAAVMAAAAIVFGTRHIDASEHQHGLMQAVAVQSVFKLVAFVTIGVLVMFALIGGVGPMLDIVSLNTDIQNTFFDASVGDRWLTMTLLSAFAVFLLPQQFHAAVVENENVQDIRRAAFLFPLYLFLTGLFVVPIAVAGLYAFEAGITNPDTFVLALPVRQGNPELILLAFLGGLSAATAMIVIEAVVLSIMICNSIVVPLFMSKYGAGEYLFKDMGRILILVRRGA
ncbi:MAG: hybrid sensor histidine kinase/response regulator, partial [Hyphomicrobiales bacterium]|nr:hybrid sensor histidine kinase/response regulator [Hyphomicrobiales bacterium]